MLSIRSFGSFGSFKSFRSFRTFTLIIQIIQILDIIQSTQSIQNIQKSDDDYRLTCSQSLHSLCETMLFPMKSEGPQEPVLCDSNMI